MYTIDTNILIYHANGEQKVSEFLFSACEKDISIIVPTIAVVEFFSFPAITPRARELFHEIFPYFRIAALDYDLSLAAAEVRKKYKLKLGDSVIAATALVTNSALVTRDRQFLKIKEVAIVQI